MAATLRRNWTITRFRDYVREPKSDGYRALHLINRHRGHLIEVQLRTPDQDFWANKVEVLARGVVYCESVMSPDDIKHFLVIYHPTSAEVEVERFGTDYEAAQVAYAEAEQAQGMKGELDVVLLSADSLATIKKTHSSYFSGNHGLRELLLG